MLASTIWRSGQTVPTSTDISARIPVSELNVSPLRFWVFILMLQVISTQQCQEQSKFKPKLQWIYISNQNQFIFLDTLFSLKLNLMKKAIWVLFPTNWILQHFQPSPIFPRYRAYPRKHLELSSSNSTTHVHTLALLSLGQKLNARLRATVTAFMI